MRCSFEVFMLCISNLELAGRRLFMCCEIYCCIFYDPLNFIGVYISDFSWPWTHFHDPLKSGMVSFRLPWQFHGPQNLVLYVLWPIKFNFDLFKNFMAMETDFNGPIISILDQWQLFMAMKMFFMTQKINGFQLGHENRKLRYSWPWKKIHQSFMSILWDFYETKVGSVTL